MTVTTGSAVPFGREFRKKYFEFDPEFLPLNHGSYGATPIPVIEEQKKEQAAFRRKPDEYLRYTVFEGIEPARKELAKVVDADPENVGFVQNATVGINTVLRSLPFKKGDVVIAANTTYGACANTIKFLAELFEIIPIFVKLDYPLSSDEIVDLYSKAIDEGKTKGPVKLGFFDAISSMPSARLPWERLVQLCKDKGVLSVVDAAHGIGMIENISLRTVRPDFFVTNIHKWFFAPAPAALLYVDPKHHKTIQTLPVSWTYVPQDLELTPNEEAALLNKKFGVIGTADYSTFIVATKAAEFRREVCGGEHAIITYTTDLAKKAGDLYAKELGAELLTGGGPDDIDIRTALVSLYLPLDKFGIPEEKFADAVAKLPAILVKKYNVFIPVFLYNGRPMIRLSAQVYVELADFEGGLVALKSAINDYKEQISA